MCLFVIARVSLIVAYVFYDQYQRFGEFHVLRYSNISRCPIL